MTAAEEATDKLAQLHEPLGVMGIVFFVTGGRGHLSRAEGMGIHPHIHSM